MTTRQWIYIGCGIAGVVAVYYFFFSGPASALPSGQPTNGGNQYLPVSTAQPLNKNNVSNVVATAQAVANTATGALSALSGFGSSIGNLVGDTSDGSDDSMSDDSSSDASSDMPSDMASDPDYAGF
jgi:hypothetical protein